jgi:hypothetical protein
VKKLVKLWHWVCQKTWDEIDSAWIEQQRVIQARKFGLLDHATWDEINTAEDEQQRATIAAELGIVVTDHAIEAERLGLTESVYPSWRNLLTELLDLAPNASAERIVERIREIRALVSR